mgnify:FL=1
MEGETVIAGVDTHKDVHVLCLLDGLGRKIWSGSFGACLLYTSPSPRD